MVIPSSQAGRRQPRAGDQGPAQLCPISVTRPTRSHDQKVQVDPVCVRLTRRRRRAQEQQQDTTPASPAHDLQDGEALGFGGLLKALQQASGLKLQMAALDSYKLRLKSEQGEKGEELADAYILSLHLYFLPGGIAIRRAVGRILSELSARAKDGSAFELAGAAAFIAEVIGDGTPSESEGGWASAALLSMIEDLCSMDATRRALLASPQGQLPKALTSQFVVPLLERAYASLAPAPPPPPPQAPDATADECRPLSVAVKEGGGGGAADSCKVALEALRALVSLFHLHHQNKSGCAGCLLPDAADGPLRERVRVSCVCFLNDPRGPNELRAQAALVLTLLMIDDGRRQGHTPAQQAASVSSLLGAGEGEGPIAIATAEEGPIGTTTPQAQLLLVKAALIALPPPAVLSPLPGLHQQHASLLTGTTLETVLRGCADPSPSLRLLSFGGLEAWLNKTADALLSKEGHRQSAEMQGLLAPTLLSLREALPRVGKVILWNWEHSNKKVSASIPAVFESYLRLLQGMEADSSLQAGLGPTQRLEHLVLTLGRHSSSRRCRYEGLRSLLPRLGCRAILQHCPTLLPDLLGTVSRSAALSGAASRFFIKIIETAASEHPHKHDYARHLWLGPLASPQGLLCPGASSRQRIANYLLESLLRLDGAAFLPLLAGLRAHSLAEDQEEEGEEADMGKADRVLWALVAVGFTGRTLGLAASESLAVCVDGEAQSGESGMLSLGELRRGCLSGNDDLRLSALLLLVSTSKSVRPLTSHETRLLEEVLPLTLKAPLSIQRHGLLRVVRQLVSRSLEALRVARHRDRGTQDAAHAIDQALHALATQLAHGLYPGANMSRDLSSLESLQVLLSSLPSLPPPSPSCLLLLHSGPLVLCLFNLLLSTWDRTRLLAHDLLATLPSPLPGLESATSVGHALRWAWSLAASPRRRESEAGALLLRVLYRSYVQRLGWHMRLTKLEEDQAQGQGSAAAAAVVVVVGGEQEDGPGPMEAALFFLSQLGDVIDSRLDELEAALDRLRGGGEMGPLPGHRSIHGLIQALRFAMEETTFAHTVKGEEEGRERALLERLIGLMKRSLTLALQVIGEAEEEDLIVARRREDGSTIGYVAHAGPVQASASTPAKGFLVDCRGHMYQGEGGAEGEEEGGEEEGGAERLVVGTWLMTREAGACLVSLIRAAPSPLALPDASIADAGLCLLQALGRFKHMGGIQVTTQALSSLVSWMLSASTRRPALARLPSQWLSALLQRLRAPSPRFLLRRSAGLAYGFLALVSAEPKASPSTLLPTLIRELLHTCALSEAAAQAQGGGGGGGGPSTQKQGEGEGQPPPPPLHWGVRVHGLNVLRLLLIDRSLNKNVTQGFFSDVMRAVLCGFRDPQWAVRNSSLMVFGALVTLIVGSAKNELGGGLSPSSSTTTSPSASNSSAGSFVEAADFFGRHVDFFHLLVSAFRDAALDSDKARSVVPALYPLLLLLSRLWLSGHVALPDAASEALLRECVDAVILCGRQPNALIRAVAGRALAALTPSDQAAPLALTLLARLPSAPDDVQGHTQMHGTLVMVNSLLQLRVLDPTAPCPSSPALLGIVQSLCGDKAWLAGPRMRCPPIRQEALQALHTLHRHHAAILPPPPSDDSDSTSSSSSPPSASAISIAELMGRQSADLLALLEELQAPGLCPSRLMLDGLPGLPQLLAWVVEQLPGSAMGARVTRWLAHPVIEVRQAALRRFMHVNAPPPRSGDKQAQDPTHTPTAETNAPKRADGPRTCELLTLLGHVAVEEESLTHLHALLEAMARLAESPPDGPWGVARLWGRLERLVTGKEGGGSLAHSLGIANGDAVALALQLMGACIRWSRPQTTQDEEEEEEDGGEGVVADDVVRWSKLVASSSVPQQGPALRQASVRAIRASHLLLLPRRLRETAGGPTNADKGRGEAAVRVGFALLRLMQDDDEAIRSQARVHASTYVTAWRHVADGREGRAGTQADLAAPIASDELLRLLQDPRGVSGGASHASAFVCEGVGVVCEGAEGLGDALRSRHVSHTQGAEEEDASPLHSKIFEPEPANLHAEPLALACLAFRHVLTVLATLGPGDTGLQDTEAQATTLQALRAATAPLSQGLVSRALHESDWLGGPTYDPEVYARLFCTLLAGLLSRLLGEGGMNMVEDRALERLEQAGGGSPTHGPIVWAARSLRHAHQALQRLKDGAAPGERARVVREVIEWGEVDRFGPFMAPRYWA